RFLVLSRLHPELAVLHDVALQRIFDEGNLHETAMLRELEDAGFSIVEQQRPFEWKKFELSGRIDARLLWDGALIPLEIKSASQSVFSAIKAMRAEEMVKSKYYWVRRYPAQLLMYLLMSGEPFGIILFKNKQTGEKCQKNFELNDENLKYAESILKKLEIVNRFVAQRELPSVEIIEDCKGCRFAKTACFPGKDYGPGFDFISDRELEAKLLRWEETKEAAKEHEELDTELKEHFRGKSAIVGDFIIESKEYERTTYAVPDEIKKQYVEKRKYWRTTIEKL
ncbi:MAG: hypothetical protein ACUVWQ_11875, partial [Candidatus Aminicenantales bacterium]